MKIHMVSLEDGITATGFRKISAYVEHLNSDTDVFYVGTPRYRSVWKSLFRRVGEIAAFTDAQLEEIARGIAGADVVAFSSMTGYSDLTRALVGRVRRLNRSAYILWGGIHPIIHPADAITAEVDAICTGEGELAFEEFFDHFNRGTDFTRTANFWFKIGDQVIRNQFRPLLTPAELERLPFPKYGGVEYLYRAREGFTRVAVSDYLANNGLGYPAIWSIGCPLHCTFCGNTVFIANDKAYAKLRHTTAGYIVGEVVRARRIHPHLQSVLFYDDSFLAIPLRELAEFARLWREQVNLPFTIFGVIPSYVRSDKLEVLTWAGLNRVRMGIQSGSDRMLRFYRRPTPIPRVEQAAETIAKFAPYHINPAYDIIVDNPVETRQDVVDTLELVYRLARPFTLQIYSLRVIPNTVLEQQLKDGGFDLEQINANYTVLRPTLANVILYILLVWRPPQWMFHRMLRHVRAYGESQSTHPILLRVTRIPWLILQGLRHLRGGEFSVITGRTGYILWRSGILGLWRRIMRRVPEKPTALDDVGIGPIAQTGAVRD